MTTPKPFGKTLGKVIRVWICKDNTGYYYEYTYTKNGSMRTHKRAMEIVK